MQSRLVCAGILVVCTACGGWRLARRATLRAWQLREMIDALELISVQLNQGGVRLGDAFGESACAPFQDVGKEMRSGLRPADAWARVMQRRNDVLMTPEKNALSTLFSDLGERSRSETTAKLNAVLAELVQIERTACERAARAEKLYPPMGMLAGLAIAVLMV